MPTPKAPPSRNISSVAISFDSVVQGDGELSKIMEWYPSFRMSRVHILGPSILCLLPQAIEACLEVIINRVAAAASTHCLSDLAFWYRSIS